MSLEIQFGDHVLATELGKMDLEDLSHSKLNQISSLILDALKEQILQEMRQGITDGNLNEANQREGYLQALEDFQEFFKKHIPEALKSDSSESVE